MADHGECGNCKCLFDEQSSKITSILSTWGSRKDYPVPGLISVYEALSVIFEIPPLTPNKNETESGSTSFGLSKKQIFKQRSRFTKFLEDDDDDDESFEGGYALCLSCSEMLTVTYNSLQDFLSVCKAESQIGRILKELEKKEGSPNGKDNPTRKKSLGKSATDPTAIKSKEKHVQDVIIKTEPRDVEDNYYYDEDQNDGFSQTSEVGLASVTNTTGNNSDLDDNGGGISRPCSPDSYNSENDVKFGKTATVGGNSKVQKVEPQEDQFAPQRRSSRVRKPTKRTGLCENDFSDDSEVEENRYTNRKSKSSVQKPTGRLKYQKRVDSDDEYVPRDNEVNSKQRRPLFAVPFKTVSERNNDSSTSKTSELKQLECPTCGKTFLHENTLICHRRLVHRENIVLKRPSLSLSEMSIQNNRERVYNPASVDGKTSTCPVCRLKLPRNEIKSHLSTHTRSLSKPWMCTICGAICSNQANYTHHMNKHKSSVPCKRCGRKVPKVEMVIHMRACLKQNGGPGSYSCKNCSQTFKSSVQLMEHRSRVHGHVWKCKLCGSKFSLRAKMIEHMQSHSKKKAHRCKICDKAYDRSDVLRLHMKRFHRNEAPPSVLKSKELETGDNGRDDHDPIPAEDDSQTDAPPTPAASTQGVLPEVEPIYENRFICKPCDISFRLFEELEEHLVESHAEKESSTCNICTRKFQDNYCLKLHMKVHSETKPLTCFICSKTYKEKNTFFYHIKDSHQINSQTIIAKYPDVFSIYAQDPSKPFSKKSQRYAPKKPIQKGEYPCDICGKIFPYLGGVKRHIKVVHDQIRDFMCSYCGKGFSKKSYFLIHERLHTTTDAPYKCHLCGKGFRLPGNLRMHLKSTIHNPNKDFVCEVCGKGFNRMDNMKLHVKAVHMKIQIRKPRNRTGNSPPRSKLRLYIADDAQPAQNPGSSKSLFQQPASNETNERLKFEHENNSNTMAETSHSSQYSSESNYQHNHHHQPNLSMPAFDPQPGTSGQNLENVYSNSQGEFSTIHPSGLGFMFRGSQYR
ncbi:putative zinc finger protein [Orchesella cincta]|uniref:Putative zinc finger protein n=1 Tax=Orchesella cincta TaxID=48709 RepID=A0A1D2MLY5_ORCCI|nr:putative zinc finger protein [Orchesella cincta]